MNIFYDFLDSNKNYDRLRDSIKENKTPVLATGVVDGQKTHLIAGITNDVHKSNLVITHSELKAKEIYNDLKFFLKDKVVLYPAKDIIFYWADVKSMDIIKERFKNRLYLCQIIKDFKIQYQSYHEPPKTFAFILSVLAGGMLFFCQSKALCHQFCP